MQIEKHRGIPIGSNTRKWRKLREMKQAELANLIGVSAAALSHIENNMTSPSVKMLEKIAHALLISPEMLLAGPEKLISNPPGSP
jgi:transcriptional regulator with XRE-family HTH domain